MKITISDQSTELYSDLIDLLAEIKVSLGGEGLYHTLQRHKVIKDFILSYQTSQIIKFEQAIDNLTK